MTLVKYKFRPGIDKESTSYSNEGGWFDGDKVRFRKGNVEKMGGWVKNSANSFNGTCRKIAVHKDRLEILELLEPVESKEEKNDDGA